MSDELQAAFAQALVEFQKDIPHVGKASKANVPTKNGGSYSYDYAALPDILDAALPALAKNGLSFTASPTLTELGFVLRYALLHIAGHREEGFYPLPDPTNSSPQQIGSAVTYGRRYCFCALTGIAPDEDDDGQGAADARASDIAVRDPGRGRGKTARTKPDGPQDDPWTAPLTRITDADWFADVQARLDKCGTAGEVRGLIDEARGKWHEGRLSDEDSQAWKQLTDARMAELGAAVSA